LFGREPTAKLKHRLHLESDAAPIFWPYGLSIPANLRRVEALEKGRWIDVNISGADGCPPMVLRITKASRNQVKFALFAVE
jgi:hypothetical protein